tara:strand:- start:72 stop:509 length:438 start_codon:yes stop_codon:yes gene_type:complete
MFAEFDETGFPLIKVVMNNVPESDDEFNSFLNKWSKLYDEERDFQFLFDTTNVGLPHIKYSVKMSQFIKNLKRKEHQYLQESIILINNNKVKWLLDFIFTLQPPVAPVYIYNINNGIQDPINLELIKNNDHTERVEPGKSLLPIL